MSHHLLPSKVKTEATDLTYHPFIVVMFLERRSMAPWSGSPSTWPASLGPALLTGPPSPPHIQMGFMYSMSIMSWSHQKLEAGGRGDGSVVKDACHQRQTPEFNLWHPLGGRSMRTPQRCLLIYARRIVVDSHRYTKIASKDINGKTLNAVWCHKEKKPLYLPWNDYRYFSWER